MMWPVRLSSNARPRRRGMEIQKVGVVGCGLMGSGIAEVCARAGYTTIVRELNDELLAKGRQRIETSLTTAAKRAKPSGPEGEEPLACHGGTPNLANFEPSDWSSRQPPRIPRSKS